MPEACVNWLTSVIDSMADYSHVDVSTTQSPLTINYHRVPTHPTDWQVHHIRQNEQRQTSRQHHRRSVKNQRNGSSYPLGRRRSAKPLKIIRHRETPKGLMTRVGDVAGHAKEWILKKKEYLADRRLIQEGPVSLRAISFTGGVAMTIASFVGLCFVHQIALNPAAYALQIYQALFGIATVIIEAKHLPIFESFQIWIEDWFPFLSVPMGKGGLYIFMGVLGGSLWKDNLSVAIVGCFMILFGFIYILVHFGLKKHLRHVGLELTQTANVAHLPPRDSKFHYPVEYVDAVHRAQREQLLNRSFESTDNNNQEVRFNLPYFTNGEQPHHLYQSTRSPNTFR